MIDDKDEAKKVAISGLRYHDAEKKMIDMTVTGWLDQPIPFAYHPDDDAPLSREVRALLAAGKYKIGPPKT